MGLSPLLSPALLLAVAASPRSGVPPRTTPPRPTPPRVAATVVPNDNRVPAGGRRNGVHELRLVARVATWHPTPRVDSAVTVQAFAEEGGAARIPGPLLRVPEGTLVRVRLRNAIGDSTLVVHGLRAGTFIYHTHMDEEPQLATGMYGALVVLEPGARWDPEADRVVLIGAALDGDTLPALALNGRREPPAMPVRAGAPVRLRLVNIHPADPATVTLVADGDSTPLAWRPRAKDGADLPARDRVERAARLTRFGVGETYDFDWVPPSPMRAALVVRVLGEERRLPLEVR